MSIEINDREEEQKELEKRWEIYYTQLVERVPGEPSEEGKGELRGLWQGRKKIERMFFTGEIPGPHERTDANFKFTKEWRIRNEDLFKKDKAFGEAYDIVRDESG